MNLSVVTLHTPDTIEIRNHVVVPDGKDYPSVLMHSATWQIDDQCVPGIAVEVFGARAPVICAEEARVLAAWLNEAAELIESQK